MRVLGERGFRGEGMILTERIYLVPEAQSSLRKALKLYSRGNGPLLHKTVMCQPLWICKLLDV